MRGTAGHARLSRLDYVADARHGPANTSRLDIEKPEDRFLPLLPPLRSGFRCAVPPLRPASGGGSPRDGDPHRCFMGHMRISEAAQSRESRERARQSWARKKGMDCAKKWKSRGGRTTPMSSLQAHVYEARDIIRV